MNLVYIQVHYREHISLQSVRDDEVISFTFFLFKQHFRPRIKELR